MSLTLAGYRKVICGVQDSAITKIQAEGRTFRLTQIVQMTRPTQWLLKLAYDRVSLEMDHPPICFGLNIFSEKEVSE